MGGMVFIDVRDRYGVTQVTCDPQHVSEEVLAVANELKNEYVVQITGTVV